MATTGLTEADADTFLLKVVVFENGERFERIKAITNFRKDVGVARILFLCRRVGEGDEEGGERFVMKVKVQYVDCLLLLLLICFVLSMRKIKLLRYVG